MMWIVNITIPTNYEFKISYKLTVTQKDQDYELDDWNCFGCPGIHDEYIYINNSTYFWVLVRRQIGLGIVSLYLAHMINYCMFHFDNVLTTQTIVYDTG